MRTFYQEMKKSISEAIEKKRFKMAMLGGAPEPEVKHEDTVQIDTASSPSLDRTQSSEDHDKLEKDIQNITQKIIEKSEFLVKLCTPEAWETVKQAENENEVVLMRTTSEIAEEK
jgi:hypothetical protein